MAEINITSLFVDDTWAYSGSKATHGENAGPQTWSAAKERAKDEPLLKTEDELDAMRRWAKETGAWSKEEIAAWDADELNALFIQLVAGDMREAGIDDLELDDDEGWKEYEKWIENQGGSLYRGTDGQVYYYLGN
jgi:hypothetical protein